jgi:hypothetical protein
VRVCEELLHVDGGGASVGWPAQRAGGGAAWRGVLREPAREERLGAVQAGGAPAEEGLPREDPVAQRVGPQGVRGGLLCFLDALLELSLGLAEELYLVLALEVRFVGAHIVLADFC